VWSVAAWREVIIAHNWLKLAELAAGAVAVGAFAGAERFFVFFRTFPHFSALFGSQGHFTE
jgi:hypothetical protein